MPWITALVECKLILPHWCSSLILLDIQFKNYDGFTVKKSMLFYNVINDMWDELMPWR